MFFFNDTATPEICTLSLHDALPISWTSLPVIAAPLKNRSSLMMLPGSNSLRAAASCRSACCGAEPATDRKSTRLNSSHANISYAVFCLKKNNHFLQVLFPFGDQYGA